MKFHWLLFLVGFSCLFCSCKDRYFGENIGDEKNKTDCEVICLTVDKDTVPADGTTNVVLTANIPVNADQANRSITFTTTTGLFVDSGTTTLTKVAEDGKATARLVVGTTADIFLVKATITAGGKTYEALPVYLTLTPVTGGQILEITTTKLTGGPIYLADGTSLIQINIQARDINFIGKKVTVEVIGGGIFPGNANNSTISLDFNEGGSCSTLMQLGQVIQTYVLKFTLSAPSVDTIFTLPVLGASPESIGFLPPSKMIIRTINDSLELATQLDRQFGKVSINSKVRFTASQIQNGQEIEVGRFLSSTIYSTAQERAHAKFYSSFGNTLDTGTLKIVARIKTDMGIEQADSIYLKVQY
jgi:hypothetical protein